MAKPDREAIRILVADIGYTEAAARTGIKRDTLYKWGQRYGWKVPVEHAQTKLVQSVQSPATAHADALRDANTRTRMSLATTLRAGAEHSATLEGKEVLRASRSVKDLVGAASQLHGWEEKQQHTGLNLSILSVSGDMTIQVASASNTDRTDCIEAVEVAPDTGE